MFWSAFISDRHEIRRGLRPMAVTRLLPCTTQWAEGGGGRAASATAIFHWLSRFCCLCPCDGLPLGFSLCWRFTFPLHMSNLSGACEWDALFQLQPNWLGGLFSVEIAKIYLLTSIIVSLCSLTCELCMTRLNFVHCYKEFDLLHKGLYLYFKKNKINKYCLFGCLKRWLARNVKQEKHVHIAQIICIAHFAHTGGYIFTLN